MIRLKPPVLRLESLEDRAVPAVFGEPWLDGRHLTLSFAGDGTSLSGVGSNLTAALSPLGWQGGKAGNPPRLPDLGGKRQPECRAWYPITTRCLDGRGRSKETRGSATSGSAVRTLASDVLAITSPFSLLTPTAGDLILNTGKAFAFGNVPGKYDLFTVAMQESGHAFGIGNSVHSDSVMYEQYGSSRTAIVRPMT